jgi:DNA mismatch repair protein MutL
VKNPSLTHALYGAYGDMLMRDRHPLGFIFIELDPLLVDVNVHPAKAEVRFRNQSQIHDLVRDVIREALRGRGEAVRIESAERVREAASDYLSNAEFGMRNAEYEASNPRERVGVMGHPGLDALQIPFQGSSHSAFGIPQSELLYPLAQVHDSFIIAQSEKGMVMIDQHAAHERVLFERLQDQFSNGNLSVQNMLIPLQVELGAAQGSLLSEHLPELDRLGFIVEDFGNGAFVIKGVPALLVGADYKKLLLDVLDEVNIHGRSRKLEELRDDLLSVMACHPAIKVHRKLDVREMERLIADLFSCRMPHTCPHGRPTMVRFSIDEIKKLFKRL